MADVFQPFGVIPLGSVRKILLNTGATGQTVAVTISKDGAAFANPSAGATNATEIAGGWYYFIPSATDTGTDGPLIVKGNGGGNLAYAHGTVLNSLPTAVAGAASGLHILGANTGDTTYTGSSGPGVTYTGASGSAGMVLTSVSGGGLRLVGTSGGSSLFLADPGGGGYSLSASGSVIVSGSITGTNAGNDLRINGVAPGAANGLWILGANTGNTSLTASSTNKAALQLNGGSVSGSGLLCVAGGSGSGANFVGGTGSGAGINVSASSGIGIGVTGSSVLGDVTASSLTVSGATTFTGAVVATNANNDIRGITPKAGSITDASFDAAAKTLENATPGPMTGIVSGLWRLFRRHRLTGFGAVRKRWLGTVSLMDDAGTVVLHREDDTTASATVGGVVQVTDQIARGV